jgi:hypothetical protein
MAVLAIMAAAARAFPMPTASHPLVAAVAAALAAVGDREQRTAGDTTAPLSAARLSAFPALATAVPTSPPAAEAAGERALEGKLVFLIGSCLLLAGPLSDRLEILVYSCAVTFFLKLRSAFRIRTLKG